MLLLVYHYSIASSQRVGRPYNAGTITTTALGRSSIVPLTLKIYYWLVSDAAPEKSTAPVYGPYIRVTEMPRGGHYN